MLYFVSDLHPRLAAALGEAPRPAIERLIDRYGLIPPLAEARQRLQRL